MKAILLVLALLVGQAFAADVPDPSVTPGLANPAITQDNVAQTICNRHWSTKSIRPPASYTTALKRKQLASGPYQSKLPLLAFEEDHLISLEIGGHPTDPRNLWPEHYSAPFGARQKDQVENYLHRQVCSGAMTLAQAQSAISTDWRKVKLPKRAHK